MGCTQIWYKKLSLKNVSFVIKKFLCFQDKIDIDFQSEYLRDDDDDDDVFNSEEDENENALFQQLNRDIDIFNRDNGVGTLGNSGKYKKKR